MRMRLSQKISLNNLTNWNQFKKEMAGKNVQKLFAITVEFVSCYIHSSYYYTHKKFPPLGGGDADTQFFRNEITGDTTFMFHPEADIVHISGPECNYSLPKTL